MTPIRPHNGVIMGSYWGHYSTKIKIGEKIRLMYTFRNWIFGAAEI